MVRAIERPSPVPSGFVVKKVSKTCSIALCGMPDPESATETTACDCEAEVSSSMLREPGGEPFIASIPFIARFMTTCCTFTLSARTDRTALA